MARVANVWCKQGEIVIRKWRLFRVEREVGFHMAECGRLPRDLMELDVGMVEKLLLLPLCASALERRRPEAAQASLSC